MKKIDKLREKALAENSYDQAKVYFKAKTVEGDDTLMLKVKMKGDQYDHYNTDRFSLRISSRKNECYFGTVSIQHPKVRGFLNEWIYHKMLKKNNLPYLKYEFKSVKFKKKEKGTYAFEQYFSDPKVFANWSGIPGPILGFRDDLFWTTAPPEERDKNYDTDRYREADIKVFNYKDSRIDSLVFIEALDLIKKYQKDSIEAQQVFDMQKMGEFYALMDLMGGRHALRWINVRYYFNPEKHRFEPLGYDSNNGTVFKVMILESYINKALHKSIMTDSVFLSSYHNKLRLIQNPSYLDEFFLSIDEEINYQLKTIYLSDASYYFDKKRYYNNQNIITAYLKEIE